LSVPFRTSFAYSPNRSWDQHPDRICRAIPTALGKKPRSDTAEIGVKVSGFVHEITMRGSSERIKGGLAVKSAATLSDAKCDGGPVLRSMWKSTSFIATQHTICGDGEQVVETAGAAPDVRRLTARFAFSSGSGDHLRTGQELGQFAEIGRIPVAQICNGPH
jgi:hypothetical protein